MSAPVGLEVATHPAKRPERVRIQGRHGSLRPFDPARDVDALFDALHGPEAEDLWAYLAVGPFANRDDFAALIARQAISEDPFFFVVADPDDRALGWLSLMRIDLASRVIEVGWILYTPALQRTPLATEAQFLAMRYAFEALGNRRYEWKCNALNAPSKRAAERFGFTYEGLFRQAQIVKGRNRDTAWYSILDGEWPQRRLAFETWLRSDNFDAEGRQRVSLAVLNRLSEAQGPLVLRRADAHEAGAILAFKTEAYLPNEAITGKASLPRLVDYAEIIRTHEIWIADDAAGYSAIAVLGLGQEGLIYSIAVNEARKGSGLGTAILAFCERRLRETGSASALLYTNALLAERIAWYERSGFARTRQEIMPDRVAQHMRKLL